MTDRSDKLMSAAMAAVQEYLDREARRIGAIQEHRPLSRWKSTKWRTLRESNHHPTNLWKQSTWF